MSGIVGFSKSSVKIMSEGFYKFPSTAYLIAPPDLKVREDKVMSPDQHSQLLQRELVVEEKVDGANLGISFDSSGAVHLQNRGEYLRPPYMGQWKKLSEWLEPKIDLLQESLSDRYILFGEWCYAKHSIEYNRLPDWFLGFDVYDKKEKSFMSRTSRDELLSSMKIHIVSSIATGKFSLDELIAFTNTRSKYGENIVEGVYLRLNQDIKMIQRAKLVNSNFYQSIEQHWSKQVIQPNQIVAGF